VNTPDRHALDWLVRAEQARAPAPHLRPEPDTIHYTDLPADPAETPAARDWNFYLRTVGRLLAEGHAGRWALIRGERVVGIWDTAAEARAAAADRFLMQPVLVHQVREREPVLRGPVSPRRCLS
jgi:hypothetical protein